MIELTRDEKERIHKVSYQGYAFNDMFAVVESIFEERGREIAEGIYFWAKAMSTQKAQTAAMFAADRVCEAFGIDADEVARSAHAKWLAETAPDPRESKG